MAMSAVLPVVVLLLVPGIFSQSPIQIVVMNSVQSQPNVTYNTVVAYRGILIGAMTRLQTSGNGTFSFTYTEFVDYGPFLESVNGLAGNVTQNTYWELLVNTSEGNIIIPDVGIGCYIPNANDQIILKYTMFDSGNQSASDKALSPYGIDITVVNSNNIKNYPATVVAFRSILIGIMTRLQTSSNGTFSFTYTNYVDYGPFLVSVNGLAGSVIDKTYWQLLVRAGDGNITIPNVGIGCYIPNPNDEIILRYTSYDSGKDIFSHAPGLAVAPLLIVLSVSLLISQLVPSFWCK